jgi:hypothetical protein
LTRILLVLLLAAFVAPTAPIVLGIEKTLERCWAL